jgi:hypothetical protein
MVDDKFRSYRNHDTVAREGSEQTSRGGIGDLLAELARLTGQGDPYANVSRDGGSSGLDWAADDAAPEQRQQGKEHHVPEPSAGSSRLRRAEMIGGQFLPQAALSSRPLRSRRPPLWQCVRHLRPSHPPSSVEARPLKQNDCCPRRQNRYANSWRVVCAICRDTARLCGQGLSRRRLYAFGSSQRDELTSLPGLASWFTAGCAAVPPSGRVGANIVGALV